MTEENEIIGLSAGAKIFIFIVSIALVVGGLVYYIGLDDERVTVEGKIVDVEIEESNIMDYDILILTFDNGETYRVLNTLGDDVDLTVNSKFIIKLFRTDKDSWWEITQIYRVPDGKNP